MSSASSDVATVSAAREFLAIALLRYANKFQHAVNIIHARWLAQQPTREEQLEKIRQEIRAAKILLANFRRTLCSQRYEDSRPKSILGSCFLRMIARKKYNEMLERASAASTIAKHVKGKQGRRFAWRMLDFERLWEQFAVKPVDVQNKMKQYDRRFNV
jgi:hypothetical protein